MTGAQIKYILTMYQIQNETGVRLTDIAAAMNISKPSVYQMIGQLNKLGLAENNGQGKYRLTEQGSAAVFCTAGSTISSPIFLWRKSECSRRLPKRLPRR